MKYTLKIFFSVLITAFIMIGIIWAFSSSERLYALNQYLKINQNAADAIQYTLQDKLYQFTDEEDNIDYVGLVNSLPMYDFNSITILNQSGTVMASTDSKIKAAFINTLGDDGKDAFFARSGANLVLGGNSYYFAKVISDKYRVMCVILGSELLVQETKISMLNVVEVLFMLLVIGICIILVNKFYAQKFNVLYKMTPVNNYTLATNKHGKILYTDSSFRKTFGKVKFQNCFQSKNVILGDALTSGKMMLIKLQTKEGETRQVAFNATSGLGEYKLVGSDVSDFMAKHEDLVHEFESDPQSGLNNIYPFERDWEEFTSTDACKEGLLCFYGMPNLDYYRTLYGEENFKKGRKYISLEISKQLEEYGKTYTVKSQNFLLIKDKDLKDKFIANIKQIQEELCKTISVGSILIKPDIRLGVIFLTTLNKDADIDYVLNAGRKALKNAFETEAAPYYIQRATSFDSHNYQLATLDVVQELIAKGGLDVYFQPQVEVKTEKVVGLEALLRLTDPKAKEVKIFDFVESAEKNGCIVELGEFIYKKALEFAYLIQKYNVTVAINISPIQLMQMGFVEKFLEEYRKYDIKPGVVHIEIVESSMIYNIKDVIQKLDILNKNGIESEIDDFGIAYSSMLYLEKLPVKTLKIDKAFIDNIADSKVDKNLVKNIINITRDLGLTCIAEGVERKEQKDVLKELDCDIIQGFYYSQAIPKEKVLDYIKKMNKKVEDDL